MDWYHEVDPKWLAARKNYLCASDIIKLLPTTPTGRKRNNMTAAYLGVWAEKQCGISNDDIKSRGAMARGHLLESYAVEELNVQELLPGGVPELWHWDNVMVERNGVSCSPDALDISMPPGTDRVLTDVKASFVTEIKAYAGPAHYEAGGLTPSDQLMERWQLATAFYVMPTISLGTITFFNPNACHPLFIREYTRAELADELAMIEEVRVRYLAVASGFITSFETACASKTCIKEDAILKQLEELSLNP